MIYHGRIKIYFIHHHSTISSVPNNKKGPRTGLLSQLLISTFSLLLTFWSGRRKAGKSALDSSTTYNDYIEKIIWFYGNITKGLADLLSFQSLTWLAIFFLLQTVLTSPSLNYFSGNYIQVYGLLYPLLILSIKSTSEISNQLWFMSTFSYRTYHVQVLGHLWLLS